MLTRRDGSIVLASGRLASKRKSRSASMTPSDAWPCKKAWAAGGVGGADCVGLAGCSPSSKRDAAQSEGWPASASGGRSSSSVTTSSRKNCFSSMSHPGSLTDSRSVKNRRTPSCAPCGSPSTPAQADPGSVICRGRRLAAAEAAAAAAAASRRRGHSWTMAVWTMRRAQRRFHSMETNGSSSWHACVSARDAAARVVEFASHGSSSATHTPQSSAPAVVGSWCYGDKD